MIVLLSSQQTTSIKTLNRNVMTTKANSTVSLKTSQGDVKAFKGKLIILVTDKAPGSVGDFCDHGNNGYVIINEEIVSNPDHSIFAKKFYKIATPIIISETERIEVGHAIYHPLDKEVIIYTKEMAAGPINNPAEYGYKKVLALPENFSPKHLRAIVDNKMKNGSEVYVQCKRVGYQHMSADFVELDSNNYITLHKIEQKMYTKEELIATLHKCHSDIYKQNTQWSGDIDPEVPAEFVKEIDDWAAQNL
jgi:hypothetical protein